MVLSGKELILQFDYDLLIILDACRYDIFEEVYEDFLTGTLLKAEAPAGDTIHWCKEVWTEPAGTYDDLTYYSCNPILNSKRPVAGFNASDHFGRIVDVWDLAWGEVEGTVPPGRANIYYVPTRGIDILHYMQPHGPWIGKYPLGLVERAEKRKPGGLVWPDAEVIREHLIDGEITDEYLRWAYTSNLKLVLGAARKVIERSGKKKVVVTSDHGELLGEHGKYLHHQKYLDYPEIREIPWLWVNGIG